MTTGIYPRHLRRLIEEVLRSMGLYSREAEALLLGTAMVESHCGRYLYQIRGGPARGIYQMEPATERDIWDHYLAYRPHLADAMHSACGRSGPGLWLSYDLAYQTAMCRLHYLRIPHPLPPADDIPAQAHYWKQHYNTLSGRGHEARYISAMK